MFRNFAQRIGEVFFVVRVMIDSQGKGRGNWWARYSMVTTAQAIAKAKSSM